MALAPLVILALLLAGQDPPAQDKPRASLEKLLQRARAEREAVQARLTPAVQEIARRLEAMEAKDRSSHLEPTLGELVALGPEAAPLVLGYLDPGDAAVERERFRARGMATALARTSTAAITEDLLALLQRGSNEGKRNAMRALWDTSEPERVRPALVAFFEASQGDLRAECLKTLIRLGGQATDALLAKVLSNPDANLVDMALGALAETRNAHAAEPVRALLADSRRAAAHARRLLAYYRALPSLVREEELVDLARLAQDDAVAIEDRIAVLEALPAFTSSLGSELRRLLELVAGSRDRKLREAARIALSRLGDKAARKELLHEYDEFVQKNGSAVAHSSRAQILERLDEWDSAIKDYQKALLLGSTTSSLQEEVYIGLARCYTRKGRYKEAADWLDKAPIDRGRLKALGEAPEFEDLRKSKYGKELFGPR